MTTYGDWIQGPDVQTTTNAFYPADYRHDEIDGPLKSGWSIGWNADDEINRIKDSLGSLFYTATTGAAFRAQCNMTAHYPTSGTDWSVSGTRVDAGFTTYPDLSALSSSYPYTLTVPADATGVEVEVSGPAGFAPQSVGVSIPLTTIGDGSFNDMKVSTYVRNAVDASDTSGAAVLVDTRIDSTESNATLVSHGTMAFTHAGLNATGQIVVWPRSDLPINSWHATRTTASDEDSVASHSMAMNYTDHPTMVYTVTPPRHRFIYAGTAPAPATFTPMPPARITGRGDGLGPLGGARRMDTYSPSQQTGFRPGAPASYY